MKCDCKNSSNKDKKENNDNNYDTHISESTIKVISDLSSNKSHIIFSFILQDKLLHYICRTIAPIYLNNRLLTTESARARKNIIQTIYVITVHVI